MKANHTNQKFKWLGRLTGITLGFVLFAFVVPFRMAFATPPPPPNTTSWYMSYITPVNINTSLYNLGCTLGTHDLNTPGTQDNAVVLLFGMPGYFNSSYGAYVWPGPNYQFLSIDQIAGGVEQFAYGYYGCTGSDTSSTVYIAAGVNNSGGSAVNFNHGSAWATMTKTINSWVTSHGYNTQAKIRAAADIEPGFGSYSQAKLWVDGYTANWDSANLLYLWNVGAAAGCPLPGPYIASTGCNNNWSVDNLYYVSYGTTPVYPFPEIYNTLGANATQWNLISQYSKTYKGWYLYFSGSLTQSQACLQKGGCDGMNNSPSTGWTQLINAISGYQSTLRWSTDMKWN